MQVCLRQCIVSSVLRTDSIRQKSWRKALLIHTQTPSGWAFCCQQWPALGNWQTGQEENSRPRHCLCHSSGTQGQQHKTRHILSPFPFPLSSSVLFLHPQSFSALSKAPISPPYLWDLRLSLAQREILALDMEVPLRHHSHWDPSCTIMLRPF